jgi:hypothetical protein
VLLLLLLPQLRQVCSHLKLINPAASRLQQRRKAQQFVSEVLSDWHIRVPCYCCTAQCVWQRLPSCAEATRCAAASGAAVWHLQAEKRTLGHCHCMAVTASSWLSSSPHEHACLHLYALANGVTVTAVVHDVCSQLKPMLPSPGENGVQCIQLDSPPLPVLQHRWR